MSSTFHMPFQLITYLNFIPLGIVVTWILTWEEGRGGSCQHALPFIVFFKFIFY